MENIIIYEVGKLNILGGAVKTVSVVNLDDNKKKLAKQNCDVTGKSARYLFGIENKAGETKNVASSVLTSAGVTQKEIEKIYGVVWSATHSSGGSTRLSKEDQATELNSFLSA